ncbi:hypothetical protein [Micromonospora ureilytica]|uniref:Uncharacterized protein n=1 Tax=Micromonospora ureilytica TaxID=709868 RepID=A0ABS0JLH6_9ACTN|nr:hypothetical protein [Micromonospora ureilytica]MBG6067861.1 hypothetical protein [Micromonospora ureilytica]
MTAIHVSPERRHELLMSSDFRCEINGCGCRASYVVILPTAEIGTACGRCGTPPRAALGVVG